MEKKSPKTPKRKSLANVSMTPNKVQKTNPSPKGNKSPAIQKNQKTPQKKQFNGRQNTPKPAKIEPEEEEEEDEDEIEHESEDEQVQNGNNADSDEDQDDSDDEAEDDDEEQEQKPIVQKPSNQPNGASAVDRKYSVFLGGLNYQTTEANLRAHFNDTSILSIRIMKNPTNNKPRGSAFINFADEASMKLGLEKNGSQLDGRKINVSVPQKNTNKDKSMERKRGILAALKRKVEILEREIGQANNPKRAKVAHDNSPKTKKPKNKNKKIKSN